MVQAAGIEGGDHRLNVLLTDGEQRWAEQLPRLLEPQGIRAIRAGDVEEAARVIERQLIHAAVVDIALPMDRRAEPRKPREGVHEGGHGGLKLLRVIQRIDPSPPAVVVRDRRFDRVDDRLLSEALKLRAFSVLDEPVELEQLLETLRRLLIRHYGGAWPGGRN